MEAWFESILIWFALPKFGLSTVFVVSFVSATLLPLGSEAAVFGLVKLSPDLFWPAIFVATTGSHDRKQPLAPKRSSQRSARKWGCGLCVTCS